MSRTRPRTVASWSMLLAILLAACTPEATPSIPAPAPSSSASISSTAAEVIPCSTGVGGTAHLEPQAEPPAPEDVPGASAGEEFELNPETAPPVPDDPNGVVPSLSGSKFTEGAGAATGGAQPDDLVLYRPVVTLDAGEDTSPTAEPEVAIDGNHVFVTWNRLAAISSDGGATFKYLNPATTFATVNGGFCCDQRILHVGRQKLWLWVLQYRSDVAGNNTIRLAWATDDAFAASDFSYIDWTGPDLGLGEGMLLDQAKIGTSDRYAYLSLNAFVKKTGLFMKGAVIRVPLDALAAGSAVAASCFTPTDPRSGEDLFGAIPTRGAGSTMYLAAHVSNTDLAILRWPDDAAAPTFLSVVDHDVNGAAIKWPAAVPYSCLRTGADADSDWCLRPVNGESGNGPRPTTAWLANGHIGVAWNANEGSTANPYPFVWVVVLDESKIGQCSTGDCVLGYPKIGPSTTAIQYAAITENPAGELGAVALLGGGERRLTCASLLHGPITGADTSWRFIPAGVSNADLDEPNSGDYLGVALDAPGSNSWIGTCMSYQTLAGAFGSMKIHVTRFGRFRDDPFS